KKAVLLSSGDTRSKVELLNPCRLLIKKGLKIYATQGTHDFLKKNSIQSEVLHWPDDKRQPNSLDFLKERKIDFVVNIPKNLSSDELNNDYTIRRTAIDLNIPLITNARLANAFITAFCSLELEEISIQSMGSYFA
ncbi:MAG: carbamoyl phosphate synthase large subunit, partial [Bacteroidales bacterium]|nr:carbamoyl phosphate synthase large subunit [Bacteroidales bacterium]